MNWENTLDYNTLTRINDLLKREFGDSHPVRDTIRLEIIRSPHKPDDTLVFSSSIDLSLRSLLSTNNPYDYTIERLSKLKSNILNTKLFSEEARKLKEYEELRTMKFAIDALEKLVPIARQELGKDKLTDL